MTLSTACPKPPRSEKRPRKHVKRRNARRYSANWKRAYGSPERCDWVSAQVCIGCGYGRNCENHHIISGGKSRKADARFVVPLCIACHDELHDIGKWSFQDKYGIDFAFEAEETETKWRIHAGAVSVIQGDQ